MSNSFLQLVRAKEEVGQGGDGTNSNLYPKDEGVLLNVDGGNVDEVDFMFV